jgi:hypothetical protein
MRGFERRDNAFKFCQLATHFFLTPKADEPVDHTRLTQVGRALRQLGIQMIPAYSPQARGRSERGFGTWQGRLPQELRLRKLTTVAAANQFLRSEYVKEFNRRFNVPAAERGTAFVPVRLKDLDLVFSLQHERVVARDNTVSFCQSPLAARALQTTSHLSRLQSYGARASG